MAGAQPLPFLTSLPSSLFRGLLHSDLLLVSQTGGRVEAFLKEGSLPVRPVSRPRQAGPDTRCLRGFLSCSIPHLSPTAPQAGKQNIPPSLFLSCQGFPCSNYSWFPSCIPFARLASPDAVSVNCYRLILSPTLKTCLRRGLPHLGVYFPSQSVTSSGRRLTDMGCKCQPPRLEWGQTPWDEAEAAF